MGRFGREEIVPCNFSAISFIVPFSDRPFPENGHFNSYRRTIRATVLCDVTFFLHAIHSSYPRNLQFSKNAWTNFTRWHYVYSVASAARIFYLPQRQYTQRFFLFFDLKKEQMCLPFNQLSISLGMNCDDTATWHFNYKNMKCRFWISVEGKILRHGCEQHVQWKRRRSYYCSMGGTFFSLFFKGIRDMNGVFDRGQIDSTRTFPYDWGDRRVFRISRRLLSRSSGVLIERTTSRSSFSADWVTRFQASTSFIFGRVTK